MTYSAEQLAGWRANRAPIRAWETRTYNAARKALTDRYRAEFRRLNYSRTWNAARSELCRRHPAEFLAILDGMSVGVGGETFIVPITSVVESLQPNLDAIRTLAGDSRMVHIRGEYLPFVSLADAFNLPGVEDVTRGIIVVVEVEDGKAALFVDELLGQHQVVIKSLEENYRRVPGVGRDSGGDFEFDLGSFGSGWGDHCVLLAFCDLPAGEA